jgi:hypothetical protein
MNSMTTVISEKAVWLETNMPKWLVYCNDDGIGDVHDVMSVVLAHLSPRGVEELYSLMVELSEDDGVVVTSTDERMYNYGGTNGD